MNAVVNPYSGVSFSNQIMSISHEHCRSIATVPTITAARIFNYLYRCGVRHFGISNYYPSTPVYPLDNPMDDTVSLTGTDALEFTEIPSDAIGCPNAEHHDVNIRAMHINGLGSTFSSGNPKGVNPVGMNKAHWKECIKDILDNLIYSDAGGVTVNHPRWTDFYGGSLKVKTICDVLDFDERVLGIEVFNKTSEIDEHHIGWDIDTWDNILITGRRCWGLCVPDHDGENFSINDTGTPPTRQLNGFNMLLCDATEYDCLRAYRTGAFYGKLYNTTNLAFNDISYDSSTNTLSVETTGATKISVVIDGSFTDYSNTNSINVVLPNDITYVRVQAEGDYPPYQRAEDTKDMIFSNPIMFKSAQKANTQADFALLYG